MVLTALCEISLVVGVILIGIALGTGIGAERKGDRSSVVTSWPDVQIQARFGTNSIGETVFSEMDLDLEDPQTKLYIRLVANDGRRLELKTRPEVWFMAGEGMRGTALIQGDWLVGFSPLIGTGAGNPNR